MKCANCGRELPDSAAFCSNCGASVQRPDQTNINESQMQKAEPVTNNYGSPAGQGGPGMNTYGNPAEQGGPAAGKASGSGKNKILMAAIAGVLVLIAVVAGVLLTLGRKGAEEVVTLGDYYVTGCKEIIKVREEEDKDSKVVTKLENGEKVSLMEKSGGNYWKVYIEAEEVTGYIDHYYLTDDREAVMDPVVRYVDIKKDATLSILSTPDEDGAALGMVKRGDEVTVLAKPDDTYAYIYAAEESAYGYVEQSKLSEEEVKEEAKKEKEKETDDKKEDKSQAAADVFGPGSPPANYEGVYYVNVATGYLALRNAKAFDASNEIGKMYNGDYVQAIRTNELYWYVYSPSLGAYGYTNSEYLVSRSASSSRSNVYYASVASGYLALRNAQAYDASNEIGKIANGQEVDVIDSSTGTYWYVYVPALSKYGYVNSEHLRK